MVVIGGRSERQWRGRMTESEAAGLARVLALVGVENILTKAMYVLNEIK